MIEREASEKNISSEVSALLRKHFGRGPQSLDVRWQSPFITMYMQDFLAPVERTLRIKKGVLAIEELRREMMRELEPTITTILEAHTTYAVKEVYYDWNVREEETATGMIWGFLDIQEEKEEPSQGRKETDQTELEKKIRNLSTKTKKEPREVKVYWLGKKELLVEQTGFLVRIEQELIKDGYEEVLKAEKQKLDKEIFNKSAWQKLLQRKAKDVFIDWNFQEDKEYIVICLEKER